MANFSGINLTGNKPNEIVDALIGLQRQMEYQMDGNLDSGNIREIGGWRVGPTMLSSKDLDVGMSTDDAGVDPIRFWAGNSNANTAAFRVHRSGKVVATNLEMSGGNIIWGNVPAPDYTLIAGTKPPADANNTYNELLFNSNIRGFVNVGGTLYMSADYIRAGTITSVVYNAYDPATPNRRLQIRPLNSNGVPDLTWWNDLSTTQERGSVYLTTGNFQSDGTGTHTYFSLWGTDRMQITSPYVWFNAGTVDFGGATILGLNNTAKFG